MYNSIEIGIGIVMQINLSLKNYWIERQKKEKLSNSSKRIERALPSIGNSVAPCESLTFFSHPKCSSTLTWAAFLDETIFIFAKLIQFRMERIPYAECVSVYRLWVFCFRNLNQLVESISQSQPPFVCASVFFSPVCTNNNDNIVVKYEIKVIQNKIKFSQLFEKKERKTSF